MSGSAEAIRVSTKGFASEVDPEALTLPLELVSMLEGVPKESVGDFIEGLGKFLLTLPDEVHAELGISHHFSPGVYAREMRAPKGSLVISRIHKVGCISIVSKGDVTILTEEGLKRYSAPATIVSPPGTRRLGYFHEDTVWTAVFATDETDVDKIESEIATDDPNEAPELFIRGAVLSERSER